MDFIYDLELQGRNWRSSTVTAFVKFVLLVTKSKSSFIHRLVSASTNRARLIGLD